MVRFRETKYLITRDGQVFSELSNKFLKLQPKQGYKVVTVHKKMYVHRLVAEVYLDNPNNYKCVNHINSNRSDNRVENLEWCSHTMNTIHAIRVNRHQKGDMNGRAKLTESEVIEIKKLCLIKQMTHVKIAEKFGVRHETISLIHRGLSWKHIRI